MPSGFPVVTVKEVSVYLSNIRWKRPAIIRENIVNTLFSESRCKIKYGNKINFVSKPGNETVGGGLHLWMISEE